MKFETIAGIIYQGLVAYNGKDAKKMAKEFKEHMENYYDELDKPSYQERHNYPNHKKKDFRDNNVIDSARRGVYIIGETLETYQNGGQKLRDILKS